MRTGFIQAIPVDETVVPASLDERELYKYRIRVLDQIVEAAKRSDIEEVQRLADLL